MDLQESERKAYDGFVKSSFLIRITEELYLETDNLDDDKVDKVFEWAKDAANVYWQHDDVGARLNLDDMFKNLRDRNLLDELRKRAEHAGAVDPLKGFVPATPEEIEAARVNPALHVSCARCGEFTTRNRASSDYGSVHARSCGPTRHTFIPEIVGASSLEWETEVVDMPWHFIKDGTGDTVTSCDWCGSVERWQTVPGMKYAIRRFYTRVHVCK